MNILALDQASRVSGWSVFDTETGELKGYGKFDAGSMENGKRLHYIRSQVQKLIDKYEAKEIAFEDIQLQESNNPKTYKVLAQVQGTIMELAVANNLPYQIIPPSTWRAGLSLPNGRGIKREQQKKYAQDYVLKHQGKSVTQDEADAICIGTYYINSISSAF